MDVTRKIGFLLVSLALLALVLTGCVPVRSPQTDNGVSILRPDREHGQSHSPPATRPQPRPVAPPSHATNRPSPTATSPLPAGLPPEQLFALQINLDRARFSPGCIDGHWGGKTHKALDGWLLAQGRKPYVDGTRPPAELLATNDLWTTYVVTAADHSALTPWPDSWLERSRQTALGHVTIREAVAERFHLSQDALVALNPALPWPNPPPGTRVRVPALPEVARLPGPLSRLDISVSQKTVRAWRGDALVAQFPCSIAADKSKRPVGQTLKVGVCADRPEYTFDPALYANDPNAAGIDRRLRIPPGPNNPVGLAWIGLAPLPGYGLHGTPVPEKISHTESHGCFRLANWDARALLRAVTSGLPVHILP